MSDSAVIHTNLYLRHALAAMPRLISTGDREPLSQTYGCFDRTFWGWKFTDFPGARFQEAVYPLAWFFTHNSKGNDFYQKPKVLDWIRAGMRWWSRIQYADGSFDEAYPFEHSLAATAFTSFYVGEAFLLIQDKLSHTERQLFVQTFQKAGHWLCTNDETHGVLSNHLAAAAAALTVIYKITGDVEYQNRSNYFLNRIYNTQSEEGWYEEYGGADPGYQTHGTFYLARIWQYTQDSKLLESLKRANAFLKVCIHPNGTLGGVYGSRATEFFFPAGYEILASVCPDSADIAAFMRPSVNASFVAGLEMMDPYNYLPQLNNYLFAQNSFIDKSENLKMLFRENGRKIFPEAGLWVESTPQYYALIGLRKGGVIRVYDQQTKKLVFNDCGYWLRLKSGKILTSQSLQAGSEFDLKDNMLTFDVAFAGMNQRVMNPWLFMGFRGFSLSLGRIQAAAFWLKNLLVQVLVKKRTIYPIRLKRTISLSPEQIEIQDDITGSSISTIRQIGAGTKFSAIHMGSSRYFEPQELEPQEGASDEVMRIPLEKTEQGYTRRQTVLI